MKLFGKRLCATILAAAVVAGVSYGPISSNAGMFDFLKSKTSVQKTKTKKLNTTNTLKSANPDVNSDADIGIDLLSEQLGEEVTVVKLKNENQITRYLKGNKSIMNRYNPLDITSVDNSKRKYFPKIDTQGSIGSCTAWATVYYQFSYAVNKALNRDGKLPENTFSPTWTYNLINEGRNQGTYYSDTLAALSQIGAVPMTMVPAYTYEEGNNIRDIHATKENWLEASKYKVSEFYNIDLKNRDYDTVVTCNDDADLDAIKKALFMGEILSATTYSDNWNRQTIQSNQWNKENDKHIGETIITRCDGDTYGSHRITIVGYNDDIWVDINEDGRVDKGEKGAFKIANSWGDYYDNDGFVWMSYDAINKVSSVKDSENVKLKSYLRKAALFDIIGFKVDVDENKRDCFVKIDMETDNADQVAVNITATDRTTGEMINALCPIPFLFSDTFQNLGMTGFDGSNGSSRGEFYLDLTNVVPEINKENLENYDIDIVVSDTFENGSPVKVNDIDIYIKSENKYLGTAFSNTNGKVLNNQAVRVKYGSTSEVQIEEPYWPEAVG